MSVKIRRSQPKTVSREANFSFVLACILQWLNIFVIVSLCTDIAHHFVRGDRRCYFPVQLGYGKSQKTICWLVGQLGTIVDKTLQPRQDHRTSFQKILGRFNVASTQYEWATLPIPAAMDSLISLPDMLSLPRL